MVVIRNSLQSCVAGRLKRTAHRHIVRALSHMLIQAEYL